MTGRRINPDWKTATYELVYELPETINVGPPPKTKPMTEQDQVAALAELDGFHFEEGTPPQYGGTNKRRGWTNGKVWMNEPLKYLTSYDAIIPLIQKQPRKIIAAMEDHFEEHMKDWLWLKLTPSQLTEALLRAHGKWKE